jgi:hypothetical protein
LGIRYKRFCGCFFIVSRDSMEILKAGTLYFALVFGAGFLLGAIRVPLLVPRFGERTA